jgi:hypothetical protein
MKTLKLFYCSHSSFSLFRECALILVSHIRAIRVNTLLLANEHIFVAVICLWLYSSLLDLGRSFSFLILYTVGRSPWTGDQPVARPLAVPRTTQTQNKRRQYKHPCLDWDPNLQSQRSRERRVHASYRAETLIGLLLF